MPKNLRKTWGGVQTPPPPARRGLRFDLFIRCYELVYWRVKDSMLSLVWPGSISNSRIQYFQKTLHQKPPSSQAIRQWYIQKGSEHRICQKTKRKRKEKHFGPASSNCSTTSGGISIIQGLCYDVNLLLNNLLNNCWIPVRNALPLAFLLSFDRAGDRNLFVTLSYGPWWWRVLM